MSVHAMNVAYAPGPDALATEDCPLCDGSRSTLLHRVTLRSEDIARTFELRKCQDCELVFVDPRLSDSELVKLYDEDFYFSTQWPYQTLASWVIDFIQTSRRHRIEQHVRSGRLLDIGSGDGRFVHHMAANGWDATGIDFSPAARDFASQFSSRARFLVGSLEDYDFRPGRLDLITLWQVLEHIGEPRPLLHRCHDLLDRGGVLVVSVPNIEGFSSQLTGERWWGLDVPRHLVHYSPGTLRRALDQAGFRDIRIRHQLLQYDPYALLHSSLDWVFTQRHFLSDLAKGHVPSDMDARDYAYNLGVLLLLGPMLTPVCVMTATASACLGRGGFIEAFARRD